MEEDKLKTLTDQRPFFLVYQDFLKSNVLDTPYQKLLFIALKSYANSDNTCFPSISKLAEITKMSKRKVQTTLKELEEKKVLKKVKRISENGGMTSNLYTLIDVKEVWENNKEIEPQKTTITEEEKNKMIKLLEQSGYTVTQTKKEVPASKPTTAEANTPNNYKKYTKNVSSCQDNEQYSLVDVKKMYEYNILTNDYPYKVNEIDAVFNILYEILNTTQKTIRVNKQNKSVNIVKSKFLKLTYEEIMYCIKKYQEQTQTIKNHRSYIITMLYNCKEQMELDITNSVASCI